jgi:hypothetical protein
MTMENRTSEDLLDDLELTKHEELLLRHLVGLRLPEPRGYWGRFFQTSVTVLRPREAFSALVIVVAIAAAIFYVVWKWPFVSEILGAISLPLLLFTLVISQDRSSRLIRKLYHALERAKVSGQDCPEVP